MTKANSLLLFFEAQRYAKTAGWQGKKDNNPVYRGDLTRI